MRKFAFSQFGKVIAINLEPGDLVLESIKAELEASGGKNAVLVSALGSMCKLNYHVIGATTRKPQDLYRSIEAPVELGAMQGMVLNGAPHIHLVASTPDGVTHIGHLEPGCVVQYLIEMAFIEVKDMELYRDIDDVGIGHFARV